MKICYIPFILMMIISSSLKAQSNKFGIKFNFGASFSEPMDDIGQVATKGKAMQPFTSLEASYHISYSKKSNYGFRLAGVAGTDNANFLANDRSTEVKVFVPNFRARFYPFTYNKHMEDGLENFLPKNLPFLIEIPTFLTIAAVLNGLHFDLGYGNANILETAYSSSTFQDAEVKRNMKYNGWGLQPQIFQSDSEKITLNAVFDFGKYKWTNANGGTSSFKSNHVGFGVQYFF
jgi:hypothetical protein